MTRCCRPDLITLQPGDAEVRILTENLYKFTVFGAKSIIREFSDKGWNVKRLGKFFLKKLQDSGSMTRRTGSGRRRSVRSDAWLVFTR